MATTTPANASAGYKAEIAAIASPIGDVLLYGADPTGVADSTTAIQAAIDAVYASGGGDVILPVGTCKVTSLVKAWDAVISVNIRGAAKVGCILSKWDSSTTPIIDFTSTTPTYGGQNVFEDFEIIGNAKTHDGIRLTDWSRFVIQRVSIFTCDVALNAKGTQLFSAYDLTLSQNNIGYKCGTGTGITQCNSVEFFGGHFTNNTTHAIDIDRSSTVSFYSVDIENNGTDATATTGAVLIRSTVVAVSSYATFEFTNCWFESNLGLCVKIEDATDATLRLSGCHIYANTTTSPGHSNDVDVGAIGAFFWENSSVYGGSGGSVTTEALRNVIIGGRTGTYTDNSASGPNTTLVNNHIDTRSVTASAAQLNQGQVGPIAYLSVQSGIPTIGAYDFVDGIQPLSLTCLALRIPSTTTALFDDATSDINTVGKVAGSTAFNWQTSKPLWAASNAADGVWVDGTGATVHTPT